jgi:hypothetical protein
MVRLNGEITLLILRALLSDGFEKVLRLHFPTFKKNYGTATQSTTRFPISVPYKRMLMKLNIEL